MKKVFSLTFLLFTAIVLAQDNFISGYYIDQNNTKIEGFIEDSNPYNNPEKIYFKSSLKDKSVEISITNIKEYKVSSNYKHVRYIIDYDSDQIINNKEINIIEKKPNIKPKLVLLKVLVEGDITLFEAIIEDVVFFYFKNQSDLNPKLLIHRKYSDYGVLAENNDFRKQLYDELKSEKFQLDDFLKIQYEEDELINIFKNVNKENKSLIEQNINTKKYKSKFYYKVIVGVSSFAFPVKYREEYELTPSKITFTNPLLGIELSNILGTNSNRSEFFCRLFYQKIKTESNYNYSIFSSATNSGYIDNYTFKSSFNLINISGGYRYAFVKNENGKLCIDGSLGFSNVINGDFTLYHIITYIGTNQPQTEVKFIYDEYIQSLFFNVGISYIFKNKYGVNFEYSTPKNFLNRYAELNGKFSNFNLIFTYTLNN